MTWIIISVMIVLVVLVKYPKLLDRLKGGSGLTSPGLLIAMGLLVFNLVSWAMIPWFWDLLHHTWYTLVFFNIGFWSVLYFRTLTSPVASKLASFIAVLLVAGLATIAYKDYQRGDFSEAEYKEKMEKKKTERKKALEIEEVLLKEPVLFIIARCEPKEFDSLEKVEKAKKLHEKEGLLPWVSSANCWAPRIKIFQLKLEAPIGKWSREIVIPGGFSARYEAESSFERKNEYEKIAKYDPEKEIFEGLVAKKVRLRSLATKPVIVDIFFSQS